ncbi:MAG: hypothetical protein K6L81_01995 [Agarilytica sp.]
MIITLAHQRKFHYCSKGARRFCKRHDLDFLEFVRNGYDESVLLETGDAMAIKLVEFAKNMEASDGGK